MSAYKDKTQGTWYVSFRYIDWTGKKTQKLKRGFKTKKEALNFEKEFIRKTAADMKMEMNSFIQVYFEDKKNELKENSVRNKQHMMNKHIVPYFGTRKMNEITPAEIIQWQNTIQEKGYSKTYERMIQNQLNALFNHAQKIYNLKENPCKKVKKMGKSDANKLEFWTKAEYDRFIAGIEPGSEDYLIFEILFWTGIREGDDDDKIRLNQRKPSKYKGLRRFGPEKNLQRINKFMKERPIFYKNLIQMKENIRFYLRCFYCITKVMILQFNSENRTELARNG
ncbi:Arm DNA-binding domain-containing protein [Dorea longicatena]|uniref:Arm DNA-binding domain-containing protein n=1 Tax=Dorea longicatena TaxID=88431 RepID=UPI001FB8F14E|nr:Arm DNA-binding domain-containing protein [Dorea longicatena]